MTARTTPSITSWLLRFALAAVPLLTPMELRAAAGDLDCTFGAAGIVDLNLGSAATYDAVQQSDGTIVAMGGMTGTLRLSRFLPDGDLDLTFGVGGSTTFALPDSLARALAIDSSGRFVVVGETTNGGDSEVWVARFTAAGAADTSFGGGDGWTSFDWTAATATAGVDSGDAIAVDSSDRPVVGGWTDANTPGSQMAIARLTTAGALDPTFGSGGIGFASSPGSDEDDTLSSVRIDANGRVVAIGTTTSALPLQFPRNTMLARFDDNGILDATFDGDGVKVLDMTGGGGSDRGFDLAFDSTGRILALGASSLPVIGRLTESGALDTTFDTDGLVQQTFVGTPNQVTTLVVQADDKPLVIGWPRVGTSFHFASMRLTTSGALDTTWGATGVVTTAIGGSDVARAAFLKPDQRVVITGSSNGNFIMARYLNDASTISTTTTTITSDLPDPSMAGTGFSVGVSVTADSGGSSPTGTVEVGDGVSSCSLGLTPAGGATASGSCTLALSTVGSRTLTASYQSAGTLCESSDTEPHEVTPAMGAATTTSILGDTPDPSVIGQTVTVNYSVNSALPGSPSGNVIVTDGVDTCVGTVAAGSCNVVFTTVGARSLIASYGGDGIFGGSDSTAESHQVDAAATITSILLDLPDASVVGQPVTVVYSVSVEPPGLGTPTGNVTVTDGVDSCVGTVAAGSCNVVLTTPGPRSLTASYAGAPTFNSSVSRGEFHQVDTAATLTSISADAPDPSVVGQAVTIAYAVTVDAPGAGTPTGNVTVTDGVDSCVATVAAGTCNVVLTTPGPRSLTATYAGDPSFNGSVSPAEPHQVDEAATSTTISSDLPDPSVVGQAVTVDYAVTIDAPGAGTPTGNVTVTDGVDSCVATVAAGSCSVVLTTPGARSLTATYAGDSAFNGSVSLAEPHQVDGAATSTTISSDLPDPSVVGQAVTADYAVTIDAPGAGTPTGNVTVTDGVDSCVATIAAGSCSVVLTTPGARSLTATYAGDSAFNGSVSPAEPHQVDGAATSTTISSDLPDPSVVGQAVTADYAVTIDAPGAGTPTGNVTVTDGVDSCVATIAAGSCSVVLTTPGPRSLTATYAGDSAFNGSVSPAEPHQVDGAATSTTISSDLPDPSVVGQAVTADYAVTIDAPGAGTPTGNVTVTDGVDSCVATIAAGSCSVVLTTPGPRSLTATYAGDSAFNGSVSPAEPHQVALSATTTTLISHTPDPSVLGQTVTMVYSVTSASSGTPTGDVTVFRRRRFVHRERGRGILRLRAHHRRAALLDRDLWRRQSLQRQQRHHRAHRAGGRDRDHHPVVDAQPCSLGLGSDRGLRRRRPAARHRDTDRRGHRG